MFNVEEILRKVNEEGYGVVAIRHCAEDEHYKVGDMCRNSFDWNYELDCSTYDTDEPIELDGTCGFQIVGFADLDDDEIEEAEELFNKAMKEAFYCGDAIVIAGNRYTYGDDENEVIIWDANVIAVES